MLGDVPVVWSRISSQHQRPASPRLHSAPGVPPPSASACWVPGAEAFPLASRDARCGQDSGMQTPSPTGIFGVLFLGSDGIILLRAGREREKQRNPRGDAWALPSASLGAEPSSVSRGWHQDGDTTVERHRRCGPVAHQDARSAQGRSGDLPGQDVMGWQKHSWTSAPHQLPAVPLAPRSDDKPRASLCLWWLFFQPCPTSRAASRSLPRTG